MIEITGIESGIFRNRNTMSMCNVHVSICCSLVLNNILYIVAHICRVFWFFPPEISGYFVNWEGIWERIWERNKENTFSSPFSQDIYDSPSPLFSPIYLNPSLYSNRGYLTYSGFWWFGRNGQNTYGKIIRLHIFLHLKKYLSGLFFTNNNKW